MNQQLSLFAVGGKGTASWSKVDPALLQRKAALAAGGPPGWRPNRLILMNYWHFTYEVFHFVQGRLVLRGSNGSGKSTALAAAITLTLDGEKRRERMDTFGGQGRSVAYYLVGEPGATPESDFYHHERTAYVALEFEHGTERRYATIGVGLYTSRGRPNLDVDFWGFTIDGSPRIGIDLDLFEETVDGRIPLTERQLRERLGPNGRVTDRQGQYQAMVNDLLFGMPEEEYDDLLKVLVHLRSPKLNKDIKPSDVCQILARSLPPLREDLLEQVTRIIEDIDSQQELLEKTRRHLEAVKDLDEKLDRYLNQLAQRAALDYREAQGRLHEARIKLAQATDRLTAAEAELQQVRGRLAELDEQRREQKGRLEALERSDAFAQERDLEVAERDRDEAARALADADRAVEMSRRALDRVDEELGRLQGEWAEALQALQQRARELLGRAEAAEWAAAAEAVRTALERLADLRIDEERPDPAAAMALILESGPERAAALREALAAAQALNEAQQKHELAKSVLEQAEHARDHALDELTDAEERLDESREAAIAAVAQWRDGLEEMAVPTPALDGLVEAIREYPANGADLQAVAERAVAPFARDVLLGLERQANRIREERAGLVTTQKQLKAELQAWVDRTDAEPPRREGQEQARRLLAARSIPAVPLFAACDLRPELAPEQGAALEAALEEAGLLDALVIPAGRMAEAERILAEAGLGDRWLRPSPLRGGQTLADWLRPAPCGLDEADVLAALWTVAVGDPVDAGAAAEISDGRWRLGPLAGSSTRPAELEVRYIGLENRRRRREAEIARLEAALRAVAEEIARCDGLLAELDGCREQVEQEREALRTLAAWEVLRKAAADRAHKEQWYRRCAQIVLDEGRKERAAYEALVAARERWQQALEPLPECRGRNAEGVRTLLTETQGLVQGVSHHVEQLRDLRGLQQRWWMALRAREEAEQRLASDRARQQADRSRYQELKARAEALLEKIVGLGLDELRREAERLRQQIAALNEEEKGLIGREGGLRTTCESARQEESAARRAVEAAKIEVERCLTALIERLRAYPTLDVYLQRAHEGQEGALAAAEELLKLRRTGPEGLRKAIEESQQEAYRHLTQAFARHQSDLVEYRPELDGDLVTFRDLGARLLPCDLRRRLEGEHQHQLMVVREREKELYEEFILRQVASHVRELVGRVEEWKERVNNLLKERHLSNGEVLSINWRPKPPDRVTGVDMGRVVELLRQDPDKLHQEQVAELIHHFRSRVEEVREREKRGEQEKSFADALAEVLDYRLWFEFTLHSKQPGQEKQLITDIRFTARSGAEKSLAMFIPLLAAAHARYETARKDAPRLVGLDEAFAGVDEQNTKEMFRFLVELDFSWIMTSEKLWGVAETLPGCATYELIRRGTVVTPIFYLWDGTRRYGSLEETMKEVAATDER